MSTLKVTTIQDTAGANSSTTAAIANGIAKSWVNFNGTGTVAIRASFNVSSITDNGTGDYTVNFTTALADGNYAYSTQANNLTSTLYWAHGPVATPTASTFRFGVGAGSYGDLASVAVAIFR